MLTPIPTNYSGVQFRSRLEARWAVFFDQLGVRWLYEYEGYQLPSGWYLPDFYLSDLELWIEIRPEACSEPRLRELAMASGKDGLLIVGPPPGGYLDSRHDYPCFPELYESCGGGDQPYLPCLCLNCGKFGFQFDGRGARICQGKCGPIVESDSPDKGYSSNHSRIKKATQIANAYRFW